MTTQTPIQAFASQYKWEGQPHSCEVWGYEDGWQKILEHEEPHDAIPHFVYESYLHNTMIVMTGIAQEITDEGVGAVVRVRIYVYMDKGGFDYKTGFEINGKLEEDSDAVDGSYTDILKLAISKREYIVEAKRLWDQTNGGEW